MSKAKSTAGSGWPATPSPWPRLSPAPGAPLSPAGAAPRLGTRYTDFIRDLFRRRLRVVTLICFILLGLFLVKDFILGNYRPGDLQADFWVHAAATLGTMILSAVVWARPSLSMSALRVVEVLCVALGALFLVQLQVQLLHEAPAWMPQDPDNEVLASIGDRASLRWFMGLVMYGLYVPNTLRRSLLVIAAIAVTPVVVAVVVTVQTGLFPPAVEMLLEMTTWMALGSVLAVVASHKIAILRRMGFEARKLGQYRILSLLARGGMGEVYLAEHALLKRRCALKVIRPEQAADVGILRRFEREVSAMAQLDHANVVGVYDYGYAEDGTFYYVMEYVAGLDLHNMVKRYGPLPWQRAIHFLRQAGAALQAAHSVGLIHRDVKPNNMIATGQPDKWDDLKLFDFGLVRDTRPGSVDESLTQEHALLGTPSFMSPEQVTGARNVDARSDIYSLGAVAYFLLTGLPPFVRELPLHVLVAHLEEPVTPPGLFVPGIPADLEEVVLKCLEKDPDKRFASAEALVEKLSACAGAAAWTPEQAAVWWREKEPLPTGDAAATPGAAGLTAPRQGFPAQAPANVDVHEGPTVPPLGAKGPPRP